METVVLDNGGYTCKVGYSNQKAPKFVPNSVIKAKNVRNRIFIGDQVDDCKDLSGLYYLLPFQKGYLVNWEIERQVWDYFLGKDGLKVDPKKSSMLVSEPYFNFSSIQEGMNELLFEEYDFQSIFRCNCGYLAQYKYTQDQAVKPLCCLVVDSGYSFTHIVPYYNGNKLKEGLHRINVGGKILTNHLKEIISYRQLMVMDETYVINQMKEDVCYVAEDFFHDMKIARSKENKSIVRDYVLPDYTHIKRGYVKTENSEKAKGSEQVIRMCNERFAVPEILLNPSDVGIQEMGIAEAILHSVNSLPEEMHPHLYGNIILTGGNFMLKGLKERVLQNSENRYKDLRAIVPDEFDVNVFQPESPMTYAWEGGAMLGKSSQYRELVVTKDEYEEYGHAACQEKFDV